MKRIISLALAIITLFSITTLSSGAVEIGVAATSAYYVSENPFEYIEAVDGIEVIGYLGNLDTDDKITIMDATKIQLAIAKKTTLDFNQTLLADTDRDGGISIIDVTEIQRYIAKLGDKLMVAHTLYHKFTNSDADVYKQIVTFLKKRANYTPSMQRYKYEFYNTDGSGYTMISYYEGDGLMKISNVESFNTGDSEGTLDFTLSSGDDLCEFRATLFTGMQADYDTEGVIEYNKSDDEIKLTHNGYYTQTELAQENANLLIAEQIEMMMSTIEFFMGSELDGNLYELF